MGFVIVCLSANPSVDKLFEVDHLVSGAIHRPRGFVQVPGGKGLNVARAATALGAEVTAIALLRGHAGKWIEEALAAEGVACRSVWTHGESRSSLSVADRRSGRLTEFYEHGAEVPASCWPELAHLVLEIMRDGAWLTISGSVPRGAPVDGYADLITEAREAGAPVALDASEEPLRLALEAGPDVVKVNVAEAAALMGRDLADRDAAIAAARELQQRASGDGHAGVVTRGAEGVVAVTPDGSVLEGKLYVRGRYPVGSGDAFLAGLVTGLERGDPWPDALRLALAAAAANAELPGAGRLDPARASSLADAAEVRDL